jgi:signal transduction histidine kinase/DNA-binding NarL/FixJ family response regulator
MTEQFRTGRVGLRREEERLLRHLTSWGLRERAIVLCIVLIVGSILVVASLLNALHYRTALVEMETSATTQALFLARTAEPSVLLRDERALEHIVSAAMQEPHIRQVLILDNQQETLIRHESGSESDPASEVSPSDVLDVHDGTVDISVRWSDDDLLVITPIWTFVEEEINDLDLLEQPVARDDPVAAEQSPVGYVCLWFSLDQLHGQVMNQFRVSAIFAGVVAVIASLITLSAVRQLVRPLNDLVKTTAAIAEGDRRSRAPQNAMGEVGKLAIQINEMADRLEESYAHIEGKVTARTLELERERARLRTEVIERTRIQEALEQARDAAEAASCAKSEFLANISHEIRTPMNGIVGMSELLSETELDEEQTEYNTTVTRCADALLRLLNDTLDFSKLDAGKMDLVCELYDVGIVVREVASLLMPRAEVKGVRLNCEISEQVPEHILGDGVRLRQIVTNLTENAIKFTEQGEIHVKLDMLEADSTAPQILLTVQDSGIGIPPDRQPAIFDSFTQVDGTTTRKYGGTGLGLSICRQLAELMGGTIWCESTLGVGSLFCVRLPAVLDETVHQQYQKSTKAITEDSELPAAAHGVQTWQIKPNLLVIEDNPVNRTTVEGLLRRLGCEVTLAASGSEGLALLKQSRFDVIFLDVQMPGMDGFETLRHIREDADYAEVPVIAVTAHALSGDRERCLDAGMSDYLTKPLSLASITGLLERWIGIETASGEQELSSSFVASEPPAEPPAHPMPDPSEPQRLDLSRAREALGDDDELLDEVLTEFAAGLPEAIIRLESAFEDGDWQELERIGHSLKGAGANVGANALSSYAGRLEKIAPSGNRNAIADPYHKTRDEIRALQLCPELTRLNLGVTS